jgi:hypothetical protein
MSIDPGERKLIPCPPEKCHAQRHMSPSVFATYNAMLGHAKAGQNKRAARGEAAGELIFFGKLTTLANATNRSDETEGINVAWLEEQHWIVAKQESQRRWHGDWSSNEYRVVEHGEYSAGHHDCPPYRYTPEGDEPEDRPVTRNTVGLQIANRIRKLLARGFPQAAVPWLRIALRHPPRHCKYPGCRWELFPGYREDYCVEHRQSNP